MHEGEASDKNATAKKIISLYELSQNEYSANARRKARRTLLYLMKSNQLEFRKHGAVNLISQLVL